MQGSSASRPWAAVLLLLAALLVATGGSRPSLTEAGGASPPPGGANDTRYIFFMKSPTSAAPVGGTRWLQQNPDSFTAASLRAAMAELKLNASAVHPRWRLGVTFQFELLDCFLSPHTCNTSTTIKSIVNLLDAAAVCGTPVALTLDPVQFWYGSGLWNWFDPSQPGYDPANVANVEWIGWSTANATLVAWRDWGAPFRLPTPQPNLASPRLLALVRGVLGTVVGAIRAWYEAQTPEAQALLVAVKIAEEVDVGANFYFHPGGNAIWRHHPHNASADPRSHPDWSKGLSGGMQALGYNALQTLGLRHSGGPPTRDELTAVVQGYFRSAAGAAVAAWPLLAQREMLFGHLGCVGDPLLLHWAGNMVAPIVPAYSFYLRPGHARDVPGLTAALAAYDPPYRRYAAGEFFCFGCANASAWTDAWEALFDPAVGRLRYASVYNMAPFLRSPGALAGLADFVSRAPPGSCS